MKEHHSNILTTLLSAVGIFDSLYLVNDHYNNSGVCVGESETILGYTIDCGSVITSSYSKILGIPVALIGFFYYLTVFLLIYLKPQLNLKLKSYHEQITINLSIFVIVSLGLLFSFYFVYIQLFELELICVYCMLSAITTTCLFIVAFLSKNY
ncbi:MAG: vitamin K epoxide reductase family protein [Candidatus Kariarchaeaceae archaeon]|jgi:uncharacterized membrane protein